LDYSTVIPRATQSENDLEIHSAEASVHGSVETMVSQTVRGMVAYSAVQMVTWMVSSSARHLDSHWDLAMVTRLERQLEET
jgi:hypothetical protein